MTEYRFEKPLSPAIPHHLPLDMSHPLRQWDQHVLGLHAAIYDHTFPCWIHAVLPLHKQGIFSISMTQEDISTVSVVAPNTALILKKLFLNISNETQGQPPLREDLAWLQSCAKSVISPSRPSQDRDLVSSCDASRMFGAVQRLSDDIIDGVHFAIDSKCQDPINSHTFVLQSLILLSHLLLRLRSSLSSVASTSSNAKHHELDTKMELSPSTDEEASLPGRLSLHGWEWFGETNDGFDFLHEDCSSLSSSSKSNGMSSTDFDPNAFLTDDTSNLFNNLA